MALAKLISNLHLFCYVRYGRKSQQSTVYGLKSSLTTQRRARPNFDPRRGHHGRFIVPVPPKDDDDAKANNAVDAEEEEEEDEASDKQAEGDDMDFEDVDAAAPAAPTTTGPQVKRARFD